MNHFDPCKQMQGTPNTLYLLERGGDSTSLGLVYVQSDAQLSRIKINQLIIKESCFL